MKKYIIIFFALCVFTSIATAQISSWVDENGVRHFGDSGAPENARDVKQRESHKRQLGNTPVPIEQEEPEKKEVEPTLKEKEGGQKREVAFQKSLMSLKRVAAATTSGVNFKKYSDIVGEAQFQFDMFRETYSEWTRKNNRYDDRFKAVRDILEYYDNAKSLWSSIITDRDAEPILRRIAKRHPDWDLFRFDFHVMVRGDNIYLWKAAAKFARQKLWTEAGDNIRMW